MPEQAREIAEHTAELREMPIFWRSAPFDETQAPALYLHGVPTNCDDWGVAPQPPRPAPRPSRVRRMLRRIAPARSRRRAADADAQPAPPASFLARSGGFAVDLPGFGRSGKPGYLTFTIPEYEGFIESYLELIGVERVQLVMHDWGAVGLAFAQRYPERVQRLVLIDAVPFLPGYRWHPIARAWRAPGLGELAMGVTTKTTVRLASRRSPAQAGYLPEQLSESMLEHFDHGTQRAILRLYRSASPEVLANAGERLAALSTPALVVWGGRDPYVPSEFARDYASVLRNSRLAMFDAAGHWPWLDEPRVIDSVVEFLAGA